MHLFSSQPRTLFDLLEVRALLEAESARLAALRATDIDRVLIKRRYDEMVDAHENPESHDHVSTPGATMPSTERLVRLRITRS